jgi:hypothetical protein
MAEATEPLPELYVSPDSQDTAGATELISLLAKAFAAERNPGVDPSALVWFHYGDTNQ